MKVLRFGKVGKTGERERGGGGSLWLWRVVVFLKFVREVGISG